MSNFFGPESWDTYQERPGYRASNLKAALKSQLAYRHRCETPLEDTESMMIGRAVHCAVLEPDAFEERYVLWDGLDGCTDRRRKDVKAAWQALQDDGRVILTGEQYSLIWRIHGAVTRHPAAKLHLEAGAAEISMNWTDEETGALCKGRVDWLSQRTGCIVDLKATIDPTGPFARQAANLGYDLQAALYSDGVKHLTGEQFPFVIIAVENKPPHDVVVYRMTDETIDAGRHLYQRAILAVQAAEESGKWAGYADAEIPLHLPTWHVKQIQEQTSGN